MSYAIPGVGNVVGDELLLVHYTGSQSSTITKLAPSGTIYKFSANVHGTFGPDFTIFAKDIHLFNGPYTFARLNQQQDMPQVEPQLEPVSVFMAAASPAESEVIATAAVPAVAQIEEDPNAMAVVSYEPDDLTELVHVGAVAAKKLNAAGISYFEDIIDAAPAELMSITGFTEAKILAVQADAARIVAEL